MKKLLLFSLLFFYIQLDAQSIDKILLSNLVEENNGKFEKTNFFVLNLSDGNKLEVKTTIEAFTATISRDNFVKYFEKIIELKLYEGPYTIKTFTKVEQLPDLPNLILNFKINKIGVNIEEIDSDGTRNTFKNWTALFKEIK